MNAIALLFIVAFAIAAIPIGLLQFMQWFADLAESECAKRRHGLAEDMKSETRSKNSISAGKASSA